jgi:O-acetyl-ADP-ribose deacetylase (regulator of RNase III)
MLKKEICNGSPQKNAESTAAFYRLRSFLAGFFRMLEFTTGNLLKAEAEALVNTVNTVGVMGKGIALMFKERFPENFETYARACKEETFQTGQLLVTETGELSGNPRYVVNFPTKEHWRAKTRLEWIDSGLSELRKWILENNIRSIAIPPLGCGNGGLEWSVVRPRMETALSDLDGVRILIFEPTARYQNVAKKTGVKKLTGPRAMICSLVRQYGLLGTQCSVLELQKLGYFLAHV